ncbi:MAG: CoA pyrophosphatase [Actinomycetota bacterium]|nr:CoA pyrophosphatase [Actinomycetota bacterium]
MGDEAAGALIPARRGGNQQIPRPTDARPGGPPPWASLADGCRQAITTARVHQGFERRGWAGPTPLQLPPARLARDRQPRGRPAAVLCALFEEGGEAHVILTRRSSNLRSHTGEVSFPGGRLEVGEPAVDAALREASEEVGIDPSTIDIVGPLSPLVTVGGEVLITPFVGVLSGRPELLPSPAEVERAFDVSLAELVSAGVYHEELWDIPGVGERSISFFELVGDTVWGATAWMLRDLLEVVLLP